MSRSPWRMGHPSEIAHAVVALPTPYKIMGFILSATFMAMGALNDIPFMSSTGMNLMVGIVAITFVPMLAILNEERRDFAEFRATGTSPS